MFRRVQWRYTHNLPSSLFPGPRAYILQKLCTGFFSFASNWTKSASRPYHDQGGHGVNKPCFGALDLAIIFCYHGAQVSKVNKASDVSSFCLFEELVHRKDSEAEGQGCTGSATTWCPGLFDLLSLHGENARGFLICLIARVRDPAFLTEMMPKDTANKSIETAHLDVAFFLLEIFSMREASIYGPTLRWLQGIKWHPRIRL